MTEPTSLQINNVKYVREDSITAAKPMTNKRIVVADRGWIFVGDCEDHDDGTVTIYNAKNIRKWGTTKGLGQLVNGPTNDTVADEYGTVRCSPIVQVNVERGW